MPAPYDYSRAMPKMPDPIGSYARGAELGYGIQQRELETQKQELETQQQQVELASQRAAAQRRVEMQDAIAGLMENKSSGAIRDVMTQFPETIETLKPLFSEYTAQELQQNISKAACKARGSRLLSDLKYRYIRQSCRDQKGAARPGRMNR